METLTEMNFNDTNNLLFVCRNEPRHSFKLDLRGQSLISLEVNDIFEMGCEYIQDNVPMREINKSTLYKQHGTDFSDKLDRDLIDTLFQFKEIKFDIVQRTTIQLTIVDETKEPSTTFKLNISPFKTNEDLIQLIKEKMKIAQTTIILLQKGSQTIFKKDSPLNRSYIVDKDVLTVNFIKEEPVEIQYSGKAEGSETSAKPFVDLENAKSLQKLGFSKDAPPYRTCRKGLNIEGKCKSPKCEYYDKLQISPQGFGPKEIIQALYNDVLCVNIHCKLPIEIVTCGFYDCFFAWKGFKTEKGLRKKVVGKIQESEPECYKRYNPKNDDGTDNIANWMQIWMETYQRENFCIVCEQAIAPGDSINLKDCSSQKQHQLHKICKQEFETQGNDSEECFNCKRT